jgi:hypothetical protein
MIFIGWDPIQKKDVITGAIGLDEEGNEVFIPNDTTWFRKSNPVSSLAYLERKLSQETLLLTSLIASFLEVGIDVSAFNPLPQDGKFHFFLKPKLRGIKSSHLSILQNLSGFKLEGFSHLFFNLKHRPPLFFYLIRDLQIRNIDGTLEIGEYTFPGGEQSIVYLQWAGGKIYACPRAKLRWPLC